MTLGLLQNCVNDDAVPDDAQETDDSKDDRQTGTAVRGIIFSWNKTMTINSKILRKLLYHHLKGIILQGELKRQKKDLMTLDYLETTQRKTDILFSLCINLVKYQCRPFGQTICTKY